MKKSLLVLLGVAAIIAVLVMAFVSLNNSLVSKEEAVKSAWSQVENVYQRRMDLIPNLVETVKGYAKHESETLEGVIRARAAATQASSPAVPADPAKLKAFQQSQDALSGALSRLLVVVEKYPELKANENFRDLQSQIEGSENRISVERRRYGEIVQEYNIAIRRFPAALLASALGFRERPYFEAAAGAHEAPKVKF